VDYATVALDTFFYDTFDRNIGRVVVGPQGPKGPGAFASEVATLMVRVALERPGAELCVKTFSPAAAYVATRAAAEAHAALAAGHGSGLAVQPCRPNGQGAEMLLWVTRAPGSGPGTGVPPPPPPPLPPPPPPPPPQQQQQQQQQQGEEHQPEVPVFKVKRTSLAGKLQGALVQRLALVDCVRVQAVGAEAVGVAWQALAMARDSLAKGEGTGAVDLSVLPELDSILLPARGERRQPCAGQRRAAHAQPVTRPRALQVQGAGPALAPPPPPTPHPPSRELSAGLWALPSQVGSPRCRPCA
jgi:stage V sporulation protein SpoVS